MSATVERYGMFAPGQRIGVAVSGGADSVCLLHVLQELAPAWQLCLTVLHLDHGLRGAESRADAEFVRDLAARLGLPAILHCADVVSVGGNLEQAGRDARLAFFRAILASGAVDRIALGHTRRDQAETVLFRFLRGAGTAGLSGIRPVTSAGLVRPLIDTPREAIESFLRSRGIPWREDSSNASPDFARNRIRHELLPQLARDWNPRIEEILAHTADWAQAEEAYWDAELRGPGTSAWQPPILDTRVLRTLSTAAARRLVRRAIEQVKGDLRGIDFSHIDAILRLAQSAPGRGTVQAHGVEAVRSFGQIRISLREQPAPAAYCYPLPRSLAPGLRPLVFPGPILLELLDKPETSPLSDYVYNGEMGCLDWGRVSGSLVLRNWRPGDRFQPIGTPGPKKIKTLFQLARIPLWERAQWPVLADGPSVVWTRRFGVAAGAAASDSTRVLLRIREMAAPDSVLRLNSESGSQG